MKKLKTAILSVLIFTAYGCHKEDLVRPAMIDLGKKSSSTAIKSIIVKDNVVNAVFETTAGAKYSVQIVPFGSEEPIKKEGFTANDITMQRSYDLSTLPKKNYDLIFIDISGNEAKYPITVR